MKKMLLGLTAVMFLAFTNGTAEEAKKEAPKKLDLSKLTGTWEFVSVTKGGTAAEVPKDAAYVTESLIYYKLAFGEFIMKFNIADAGKTPKGENQYYVDMITLSSPFGANEQKLPAMVYFDGKELSFCYNFDPTFSGKKVEYPTALESTKANGSNIIKLKRTKDTVADDKLKMIKDKLAEPKKESPKK